MRQRNLWLPDLGRCAHRGEGEHDLSLTARLLSGGILLGALLTGCAEPPRPSVLLVTIDTWRWDHLGAAGRGKVQTPNLDRLVREGTYLPRVQTSYPLTAPAHATILTGLDPVAHGIHDNRHFALRAGVPTLAERFHSAGYATGAVVSGAPLRRPFGLDRGFETYDDQGFTVQGGGVATPASRPAPETTDRALTWLRGRGSRPVFLWVHYYDPHGPYIPSYAGEVALVDAHLGRLLEALRADRDRRWIVLVTGDHGEGLGDHGEATHGVLLYGSTVDVPLILWPAQRGVGKGPFGLIDVAPTLCALAHLPPLGTGRSILEPTEERWLAAETAYPTTGYGFMPAHRLRRGDRVVLDHGAPEVYDLSDDPEETRDLQGRPDGQDLLRQAAAITERAFGSLQELQGGTLALPREDIAALKSLGYVSGSAGQGPLRRVDLRRFAVDLHGLEVARVLLSAQRYPEALAAYDTFLASYPTAAPAQQERGQALVAMGRLQEGEKAFARALALDPGDAVSALNLGNLALARNDLAAAERLFKESLRLEETQPEAHLNLALLYLYKVNRPAEAKPHLVRFLALAPEDHDAAQVRALLARL